MDYKQMAEVAEELQAIAKEYNVVIITAQQPHYPDAPYAGYNPASWEPSRWSEPFIARFGVLCEEYGDKENLPGFLAAVTPLQRPPRSEVIRGLPHPPNIARDMVERELSANEGGPLITAKSLEFAQSRSALPGVKVTPGEFGPLTNPPDIEPTAEALCEDYALATGQDSGQVHELVQRVKDSVYRPFGKRERIAMVTGAREPPEEQNYINCMDPTEEMYARLHRRRYPQICPVCGEPGDGCIPCRKKHPEEF